MSMPRPAKSTIYEGDNLELLKKLPDASFQMIYIDPPFNTGKVQKHTRLKNAPAKTVNTKNRKGFGGKQYTSEILTTSSYEDTFEDYFNFLTPRLKEAHRLLEQTGALYFHIDYRESHYCKVLLDEIFGRDNFLNEIIWAYDYGAKSKKKWPAKHDNIFFYAKDATKYIFNNEDVDREPYMAPGLVTAEKAERGKAPTDTWWHTIVPTSGHERTGYSTQKPEGIVRRMVQASTNKGDWCLDFFGGSGTLGAVCEKLDRNYVLVDQNPEAIAVMAKRLKAPIVEVAQTK